MTLKILVFWTGSLCSPGWLRTSDVDQVGFQLRDLPASSSQMLELKVDTAKPDAEAGEPTYMSWSLTHLVSSRLPKVRQRLSLKEKQQKETKEHTTILG